METNQLEFIPLQVISSNILSELMKSRSESDLKTILADPEIESHVMNTDRYPPLNIQITKEQIQDYLDTDLIYKDGSFNLSKTNEAPAIFQLLYSFLWKQGDLPKVKYVIQGILNSEPIPETGMVLYYFGKHLADNKQPIIDQHVIRAYSIASRQTHCNENLLTRKDYNNIQAYIQWFQNDLRQEITNSRECRYLVDQVMYALGKRLKKEIATFYPKIY